MKHVVGGNMQDKRLVRHVKLTHNSVIHDFHIFLVLVYMRRCPESSGKEDQIFLYKP